MEEDLNKMTRSDPCSPGLARVHQRLCEVSGVAGRTGTKRPADKQAIRKVNHYDNSVRGDF